MADDERSADARAAAEQALARLIAASSPTSERLIVLGGLVPPTLARTDPPDVPAHLGTTDVDILVTHLTGINTASIVDRCAGCSSGSLRAAGVQSPSRIGLADITRPTRVFDAVDAPPPDDATFARAAEERRRARPRF
jgi:hypothetical protein